MKEFEVFTTTDKGRRDEMFQFFRREGDENERKAVKFSGVEPLLNADGKIHQTMIPNYAGRLGIINKIDPLTGTSTVIRAHGQLRTHYRSTWSVAYPRSI